MGCTSSAPNMATPLNSEKHESISEDGAKEAVNEIYIIKNNETNPTNVLPACDNLAETSCDNLAESLCDNLAEPPFNNLAESSCDNITESLDRNNKSFMPTLDTETDREPEKDVVYETQENKTEENENTATLEIKKIQKDDKFTHLEEVVEKVVEFFVAENSIMESVQSSAQVTQHSDNSQAIIVDDDGSKEESEPNTENLEVSSPSQSQSSRATRWEALADIAAELPPSLAVDPLTGQIYALTK